jgi:group II intron reverse transcriptase/maturase
MQNAETVLGIIRERGRRGLPLERLYRCLFNTQLYLIAYGKIYRNDGAMTAGITPETVDGMRMAKIHAIIEALRFERYRWTPTRRVYIAKKGQATKKRPLGLPSWSDKLVQEVMRMLLDAYYEPQFSEHSHGFRTGRGCHTALQTIYSTCRGTTWFIEGDIAQCFDKLDHSILRGILAEKIHDNRFLRLIDGLLQAGYLEDWRYHATLSGSPQGSIISPLLANIYLDRLDKHIEANLLPVYNRGRRRKPYRPYMRLWQQACRLEQRGDWQTGRIVRKQMKTMPSRDPDDPDYRRLHYCRYADWLLGFTGPKREAEQIKVEVGRFLHDHLKLELSQTKTLITHGRTQTARFLGYEIVVLDADDKRDHRGHRSINAQIGLKVPADVIRAKCRPYLHHGRPIRRTERTVNSDFSIIAQYQAEFRGIVGYYQLAYNLHRLSRLKRVMQRSLVKTLARKYRIRVCQVYRRYRAVLQTDHGPRAGLQVVIGRDRGRTPLVAQWGGICLARKTWIGNLDDHPKQVWNSGRSEILRRMLANACEMCGSHDGIEVHHIRRLKDLHTKGRAARPNWVLRMATIKRKTLVVCRTCHEGIHYGQSHTRQRQPRTP